MKYMGSKASIADEIIPIMTAGRTKDQWFVDLFCGGCNLLDKVDGKRIGNDANEYLIEMWKALQNNAVFPHEIPKWYYDEWRNYYNRTKAGGFQKTSATYAKFALCGWIGFMGSFNGRFYDGGYSGHVVEVKNGTQRDYIREQIDSTLSQVPQLLGVQFMSQCYDQVQLPPNSIVYCDIPYKDTKQYAISKNFNYDKFYDYCMATAESGHKVFISEYWMPDGFDCIWEKTVTNAMNTTKTYKRVEKLFVPSNTPAATP